MDASLLDHNQPKSKTARSLMQLGNNHCRWPCGDPKTKDFYFCGDPSADLVAGRPYCLTHDMIAYGGRR